MNARIESRRTCALESFGNVADAIGEIKKGMHKFTITRGQWSMIDAALYVLKEVGPSELSIWTWTVAEYEVQCLQALQRNDSITNGTLVIDGGARVKNIGIIKEWQEYFGSESVRFVKNHSKIVTIKSESGLKLLLRGSMNLNFNPRFEQFDISEGCEGFDLVKQIESELPVLKNNCTNSDVSKASRVNECFDPQQIAIFDGIKVWAK